MTSVLLGSNIEDSVRPEEPPVRDARVVPGADWFVAGALSAEQVVQSLRGDVALTRGVADYTTNPGGKMSFLTLSDHSTSWRWGVSHGCLPGLAK